jgi:hypothetical protein
MVKFRMGNRPDLETVGTGAVNYYQMWVNQAYKQICSSDYMFDIPKKILLPTLETSSLVSTISNNPDVAVPPGASIIRHVFDLGNNTRLHWIPEAKYVNYTDRTNTASFGKPTEWCRIGSRLYLHPTPGLDICYLNVFYKQIPTDLTGDLTTIIGSEWDEAIVILATYKALQWLGEYEKGIIVKAELVDVLKSVIPPIHEEERDRREWVRPDEAYIMSNQYGE